MDTVANEIEFPEVERLRCSVGEAERVLLWRLGALGRAGYGNEAAMWLALRSDVDLHLAVDLLARGCPPETAVRILL